MREFTELLLEILGMTKPEVLITLMDVTRGGETESWEAVGQVESKATTFGGAKGGVGAV